MIATTRAYTKPGYRDRGARGGGSHPEVFSGVSDPRPGTERAYQTDEGWSRAVFGRRTGEVAAFLAPHLRAGMRLIERAP